MYKYYDAQYNTYVHTMLDNILTLKSVITQH